MILIPTYNYFIYNFSDKKPAAWEDGEHPRDNGDKLLNGIPGFPTYNPRNRSTEVVMLPKPDYPALPQMSSSNIVHKYIIPVFIQTVISILVSVIYTSEHVNVYIIR